LDPGRPGRRLIVKFALFRIVRKAGKESGSGAVHVDAWHH